MQNPDILLSICIPTFNRARYLQDLLENLSPQLPADGSVEINISDNASSDNTRDISESFCRRFAGITYFREPETTLAEVNFWRTITRARGKYVWLFGDDDVMFDYSVAEILRTISREFDYYIVNHSVISADGKKTTKYAAYELSQDFNFCDADELLAFGGLRLGLVTGAVIRRDAIWEIGEESFMKYADIGLSFFYSLLVIAAQPKSRGRYVGRKMFKYRANNSTHAPTAQSWTIVYGRHITRIAEDLKALGYGGKALHTFRRRIVVQFYPYKIAGDMMNNRPIAPYIHSLKSDYGDISAGKYVRLLAYIPSFCFRVLRWLYRARATLQDHVGR